MQRGERSGMSEVLKLLKAMAQRCPHQMSCIETGKCGEHPLCEVEACLGNNVLSLKNRRPPDCCFGVSTQRGDLCCCPQRYLLFLKVKVLDKSEAPQAVSLTRSITQEERRMMIEKEAYFIAEKRNFLGDPAEYWAEAERLVNFKVALFSKADQV